ncbi:trypsin-1-like [Drosophila hydei]|uniref:Trypsin-1-like n=1 Tax=Drosophila hydei TaxID=7224 RepID=A0A6J1LEE8_DROHY|nr:trypsin-1-like [Drosophila hydei]
MIMFKVLKWRTHKDSDEFTNDIALIFPAGYMEPEYGGIAFLPLNKEQLHEGTLCLVCGWGHSHHSASRDTNSLQGLYVPIINAETCDKLFHIPGTICAGLETMAGPSIGDSGGPLRCDNKLAGVVSL